MSRKQVFVSIMLEGITHLVGRLWRHSRKGRESVSFEYDESWFKNPKRFDLEPTLTLTQESFHTPIDHMLFRAIGDSGPDRWGRALMRRAETQRARANNETPCTLTEIDYLLGVNDEVRAGALRFSDNAEGPYLSPQNSDSIPPLVAKICEMTGITRSVYYRAISGME